MTASNETYSSMFNESAFTLDSSNIILTGLPPSSIIATNSTNGMGTALIGSNLTYSAGTLNTVSNPTFSNLTIGTLAGLLKATAGAVSAASAGTDYEGPIATGATGTYWSSNKTWQTLNTDAVPEGLTNLYFTTARAAAAFSGSFEPVISTGSAGTYWGNSKTWKQISSDEVKEGSAHWFFTNSRVLSACVGFLEPSYPSGSTGDYYRGDKTWANLNSDAVAEGSTNLYFTTARAAAAFSGSYEPVISTGATGTYWSGNKTWQALNSDAVAEGTTHLYFTNSRAVSACSSTYEPVISTGSTGTYWAGSKSWQALNSDVVVEGTTHLYFTNTRAAGAIGGSNLSLSNLTLTSGTSNSLLMTNSVNTLTSVVLGSGLSFSGTTLNAATAAGVSSLTGTANQVFVNGTTIPTQTGSLTLSLPQSIGLNSDVQFRDTIARGFHCDYIAGQTNAQDYIGNNFSKQVWSNTNPQYTMVQNFTGGILCIDAGTAATSINEMAFLKVVPYYAISAGKTAWCNYGILLYGGGLSGGISPVAGFGIAAFHPGYTGSVSTCAGYFDDIGVGYFNQTPPYHGMVVAGNVGIGTVSPTQALEVNGAIKTNQIMVSSSITSNDDYYSTMAITASIGSSRASQLMMNHVFLGGDMACSSNNVQEMNAIKIYHSVAISGGYILSQQNGLVVYANANTGSTVLESFGINVSKPAFTATTTTAAAYLENACVGSKTTPPTNGLYINGAIKNNYLTASRVIYSDSSKLLASVSPDATYHDYQYVKPTGALEWTPIKVLDHLYLNTYVSSWTATISAADAIRYTNIRITANIHSTLWNSGTDDFCMRFNGVSTGTPYNWGYAGYGPGGNENQIRLGKCYALQGGNYSMYPCSYIINIPNFANGYYRKMSIGNSGIMGNYGASGEYYGVSTGYWDSTDPITSVTLFCLSGNIASYSSITVELLI